MSESIVITGEASVRVASAFSLRRSLKLEIEHGMKKRGRPAVTIANELTGCTSRNKRTAYAALNTYITDALGAEFDVPLKPVKS